MSEPRSLEPEDGRAGTKRVPFPLTDEQASRPRRPFMRRAFVNRSMVQLTLVRFREFIREPEAVFWTFIFPILLAAGLGSPSDNAGQTRYKSASLPAPLAAPRLSNRSPGI